MDDTEGWEWRDIRRGLSDVSRVANQIRGDPPATSDLEMLLDALQYLIRQLDLLIQGGEESN